MAIQEKMSPRKKRNGTASSGLDEGRLAPRVFWPAASIMVLFILATLLFPQKAADLFSALQSDVINYFGWYYVAIIAFFVIFALYVGFSRMGDVKLGRDEDEPQFGFITWLAFLFAAGMGIGLVFYGATEPLMHYVDPRPGVTGSREVIAQEAMSQAFLHWGFHPWAIYVIVGLAIAYTTHRLGLPLSIRFALRPLLGRRIEGAAGNLIDVVALVGTLFGVATSLGLGVMQIAAGLGYLNIDASSTLSLVTIIILLMAVTTVSVVTGLERGMKLLSNGNLILAGVLLFFVLLAGPTLFIFREFVASIGSYLQNFISLTFNTLALYGSEGEAFQAAWTTFYWGWWISWSPFVGMFIARVSRGRTVREFVMGVLVVPSLMSFFWFSVLGGTALHQELFGGGGLRNEDGSVSAEHALFRLFEQLPGSAVLTLGAVLLIIVFFVTSADSGALVLGMISTNGSPEPQTWVRVFWCVVAAATAITLMVVGGSDALSTIQTIAILTALPFSLVILLMCASLYRGLSYEHKLIVRAQRRQARREIQEAVASQVSDNLDERVASEVRSSVEQVVGAHVEAAVSDAVDAAVTDAVSDAVEAKVDAAVAEVTEQVDGVAKQVDLNRAAIQQLVDTASQRILSAEEVESDRQLKEEAQKKGVSSLPLRPRLPWRKS